MLLVILGHGLYTSGSTYFGEYGFPNHSNNYSIIYRLFTILVAFIYTFHMPLFMACSGACFSLTFGEKSFRKVIDSKIKRLLIPFFWTSLIVSIPIRIAIGYYEIHDNNLLYILGHHFIFPIEIHLWFLLSLFLIFPLFYLMHPLHKKSKILFWVSLIVLSWLGNRYLYPMSNFLGIPTALKNLIWFSAGFYSIKTLMNHKPNYKFLSLSIIMQFCAFGFWVKILEPMGNSYWFCLILALWGCYNTTAICILISNWNLFLNSKIYNLLLKYNFPIYLYSDPINYIYLICLFSIGYIDFFGNPYHTAFATIIRVIIGISFGILVAKIVEYIPNLKLKLSSIIKKA